MCGGILRIGREYPIPATPNFIVSTGGPECVNREHMYIANEAARIRREAEHLRERFSEK